MIPLVLEMETAEIHLSDEQFYQLCQVNRDLRLERTADGKLIIMPPTGWETGNHNFRLNQRLGNWADADGTGIGFDSSTGFILPNGATRCEAVSPLGVIARCSMGKTRAFRGTTSRSQSIFATLSRFCY